MSSLVDARNKVPEHQRFYQAAYKNHQRLWKIVCSDPMGYRNHLQPKHTPMAQYEDSGY